MALSKCEGVILRVKDFGEADRILTILSDTDGKFDAVARGARRPRSRLVGVTQQFSRVNALLFRGRNLDTLSTVELLSSYSSITSDVMKMAYASYVAELVDLMTGERQRNEMLYALVISTFEALDAGPADPDMVLKAFEIKFMSVSGFRPELARCVSCGKPENQASWFGPEAGGLLCDGCRSSDRGSVRFSAATRELAKRLLIWDYDMIAVLKPSRSSFEELNNAFRAYVDQRVGRKLHSLDFISDLKSMERGGKQDS